ncbi:MAG: hypothetical protein HGA96_14120 [Desulfobulbaceae bacterium]|nr:hypothetical protein [Desulfobulbaceae bacterium]
MGEEIQKDFAVEVELRQGTGGVFMVMADERLIFSKKQAGRFPDAAEILAILREL